MISCAGSDTCSFGVIRGKYDARKMSEYLSSKIELEDAKIRIYWSAYVKGCGIHELGDIGLLGCKTKFEGQTVPGVDIMLGGKLVHESKDAKIVLKALPLDLAKYYIEELILEYKRLKKSNESFEKFYERVLKNYSHGALAFLMSYNFFVNKIKEYDLKISLDEKPKTSAVERFEIFHFGQMIYRKIEGKSPYGLVHDFDTDEKSVKVSKDVDDDIRNIVDRMIDSTKARAEVFSELLVDINKF
jgi:ferredoxin-nitrite reductase